jgi:hypothetical protein
VPVRSAVGVAGLDHDRGRPFHHRAHTRDAEAAFDAPRALRARGYDPGVDQHVGVPATGRDIDDRDPPGHAYLGSRESLALRVVHGGEHGADQLVYVLVHFGDLARRLTQHRRSQLLDRELTHAVPPSRAARAASHGVDTAPGPL